MHKRRAFSILELLVVVGIIAMLLAILLPALSGARASAARVACMSNLRQLLQAQMLYVSESKGYLTYPNWGHDRASQNTWLYGWLYEQGKTSTPLHERDVESGILFRYLRDGSVFHCQTHEFSAATGTDRLTSYIMNGAVCGYGTVGAAAGGATGGGGDASPRAANAPSYQITEWKDPSRQILMWEAEESGNGSDGAPWNDGSSYPHENALAKRHGRGASVGCFDGHVEWMDRLEFIAEYLKPGANRLYCDPRQPGGGRPGAQH